MNKGVLIGGAIVLVLIIAGIGGFAFLNKSNSNPDAPVQESTVTSEEASQPAVPQSLKSLMQMADNQECSFQDTTAGSSGVVYVSRGKARGDFSSTVNGTNTSSHMISDGTAMYIWVDGQAAGFKTTMTAIENPQITGQQNSIDVNKAFAYECNSWSPDPSRFSVPTNIKFQDISAMVESVSLPVTSVTVPADVKSTQCAACDSLPAAARAQCKAVLNC